MKTPTCSILLFLLAAPALAQQPLYEVLGAPGEGLGSMLMTLEDLDGDGVPELAASVAAGGFGYRVVSGATGAFVKDILGWPLGDMDADGVNDRLISKGSSDFSIASGDSGPVLWSSTLGAEPGLGLWVFDLGDVDGDGADDLLANESWWPFNSSHVFHATIYSGATGAILHRRVPTTPLAVPYALPIGDVDGDGIPEIAVADEGTVYVIDAKGNELSSWPIPNEVLNFEVPQFVSGERAGADLDGDGVPDLAFASLPQFGMDERTQVYSAMTGQPVLEVEGLASRLGGDFDGDGVDDLLLWSDGGIEAHSAVSGQRIRRGEPAVSGWPWQAGPFWMGVDVMPYFAVPLPDLDGDGRDELALADSYPAGSASPSGRLRVFTGDFTDEVGVRISPPSALCPCGPAAPGEGCPNSTGAGAAMTARGSTSVAEAHLSFTAHPLPTHSDAVLFAGVGPLSTPNPFGAGVRLLAGPYGRVASHVAPLLYQYGAPFVLGDTHTWTSGPGPAASPAPFGFKQTWQAGQTYWFQAWYRDFGPAGCMASGFNLTSAVELTMTP